MLVSDIDRNHIENKFQCPLNIQNHKFCIVFNIEFLFWMLYNIITIYNGYEGV